jgi:hypothetical protein
MQPETRFKEKVQKRLKELGPDCWVVKVQQVAIRGTPDLLICYAGKFIAMELKVGSNKASPLQEHVLQAIRLAGGSAWVVTPNNLEQCLKDLQNANNNIA